MEGSKFFEVFRGRRPEQPHLASKQVDHILMAPIVVHMGVSNATQRGKRRRPQLVGNEGIFLRIVGGCHVLAHSQTIFAHGNVKGTIDAPFWGHLAIRSRTDHTRQHINAVDALF